jgi:hypothetical protein
VFNSTGNSALVTGLSSGTTYHFAVYEFNSFGTASQFLLTNPATGFASTLSVLPVTFIDFTADNYKNNIQLRWSTAQESNSSHFEIQKNSNNNSQNFFLVGNVNAAGESSTRKEYNYIDDAPIGGTTYYRIRQVDRDGNSMYSRTISVQYHPETLVKRWLNPVQDAVFFQLTSYIADSRNEWIVYDMNGRIVHRERYSSQTIYGQLPPLATGMYVIEVRMGILSSRLRIIKTN